MLQWRTSRYLNEDEPPEGPEKSIVSVPKRNWPILVTNFNVLDNAETSSQHLNWHVYKKSTNLRRRSSVPTGP